jgi:iron complex outermembrane receptor protein
MVFKRALMALLVAAVAVGQLRADDAGASLDEVIVTAQKVEQSLQDVPISMAALDARALERASINSFMDIRAMVPSLVVKPNPVSSENLAISIRSVNPGAIEQSQDLTTAVHINGIYIARGNGLNLSVADLERIEVLRGPQGTLYGRNATAGAVNYITRKPSDEFGFRQQLTFGDYDQVLTKTTLNAPVTDELAVRLNYLHDEKDGWIRNSYKGGVPINDREANAWRADVRWLPADALTLDYGIDWSQSDYYSQPMQCSTLVPGTFGSLMDPANCSEDRLDRMSYRGEARENTVWARGHTLDMSWELAEDQRLRLLAGYREYNDKYVGMLLPGGERLTAAGGIDTTAEFSNPANQYPGSFVHTQGDYRSLELQWIGALGDTLEYNAGLYWFQEDGTEDFPRIAQLIVYPDASATTFPTGFVSAAGPRDMSAENESRAVYLQMTWSPAIFEGRLEIIPGIRYTEDDREADLFDRGSAGVIGTPISPDPAVAGTPAHYENEFDKTTPALTLQYQVTNDVMTYVKYVEGYRSGGTAIRSTPTPGSTVFTKGFKPETLESYEIGFKGDFLDNRLRVNADAFLMEFSDQQTSLRNTTLPALLPPNDIFNAGESSYEGFELDVSAALTDKLRLDASYAYIDQKYDSIEDPGTGVELKQFFHMVVPEHSASLTLAYTTPEFCLGGATLGTLDASVTWSFSDDYAEIFFDSYKVDPATGTASVLVPANPDYFVNPSYDLWNARIALTGMPLPGDARGSFGVALWGRNLADEEYSLRNTPVLAIITPFQRYWGEPRSVGVDLSYEF